MTNFFLVLISMYACKLNYSGRDPKTLQYFELKFFWDGIKRFFQIDEYRNQRDVSVNHVYISKKTKSKLPIYFS